MSRPVYVAAGGGGDALASLMFRSAAGPFGSTAVVVSYSWDRYIIDPHPGPRTPADFQRLTQISEHCWVVSGDSLLPAGGTSGLTLLARHTDAQFVLMDPSCGAQGMRQQLTELLEALNADEVVLVDVGGDVAARGDEPTLLSPLGDSLALAAVTALPVPTTVAVLGPGLDGELAANTVHHDLIEAGATCLQLDVTNVDPYLGALEFHPSEATMLIAAAAKGVGGHAEIRDKGALIALNAASATAYTLASSSVLRLNQVAQALISTRTFAEAEAITKTMCGRTELDHERRKAAALALSRPPEPGHAELTLRFKNYCAAAADRGVDLVSFRRITEVIGKHTYDPPAVREIAGDLAYGDLPLCRTSKL
ncbi:DUF1152 domain-containing protein [Actinoplanes sp. NPDC049316]|uniref:DUF1152 domain-containing protein n=1 Tax=Actinoplanes sp. NPDC049316 TaxID=3154727 RepID=UPI00343A5F98